MEPEKKKPGACPPRAGLNPHFLHTAVLKGIAVFFCSTGFFPGPYPSSGKSRQPGTCAFSLPGNASFYYSPAGQAFRVVGDHRQFEFLAFQTDRR